jgi:hypothetical protein
MEIASNSYGSGRLAEQTEFGNDDGCLTRQGACMTIPNYRDVFCYFQSCSPETVVLPSNSVLCNSAWFANKQHQQEIHSDAGIQAVERFEARLQHLESLNEKLRTLAQDALSKSGPSVKLFARFQQNKYLPSIRNALISKRKSSSQACCDFPHAFEITGRIAVDAGKCSARLVSQVGSLQALEAQTYKSLFSMLRSISDEVPLQAEDIRSIVGRISKAFAPAKSALASAVEEKANSPMPRSMPETALVLLFIVYPDIPCTSDPSCPRSSRRLRAASGRVLVQWMPPPSSRPLPDNPIISRLRWDGLVVGEQGQDRAAGGGGGARPAHVARPPLRAPL